MVKLCVVCGLKPTLAGGDTYNFEQLLKSLGYVGKNAHPKCLRDKMDGRADRRRKYGETNVNR